MNKTCERQYDILVVGGGAAGMAAALTAKQKGADVLLVEREEKTGGILNRCIHNGFGLGYFGEDLTGIEYAERFRRQLLQESAKTVFGKGLTKKEQCGISEVKHDLSGGQLETKMSTTVLSINAEKTALLSSADGLTRIGFQQCILATGSYERTIESIAVSGTRPAGVFAAGCAQGLINEGGYEIGNRIVILGSGNVGQIMGRQLAMAGKTIVAMPEINDQPGGLPRNHKRCIAEWNLPLMLQTTVTRIHGKNRICGVTLQNVSTGARQYAECDTLITALGLIPDRTLAEAFLTGNDQPAWLHLCGNCDQIYDIVDSVTAQGEKCGAIAAKR